MPKPPEVLEEHPLTLWGCCAGCGQRTRLDLAGFSALVNVAKGGTLLRCPACPG